MPPPHITLVKANVYPINPLSGGSLTMKDRIKAFGLTEPLR